MTTGVMPHCETVAGPRPGPGGLPDQGIPFLSGTTPIYTNRYRQLRGAKRRGNPKPSLALDCFASLAMTRRFMRRSENIYYALSLTRPAAFNLASLCSLCVLWFKSSLTAILTA